MGAVKQFISVISCITTQNYLHKHLWNATPLNSKLPAGQRKNPDCCPEEEEDRGIYTAVLEHQGLQINFTALPQSPPAPLSHNLQCAPIFGKHYFTVLEGLLICNLPLLGPNHSIHYPPLPHHQDWLFTTRQTDSGITRKIIFIPTFNLRWSADSFMEYQYQDISWMIPWGGISQMQGNDLGHVFNIRHASLIKPMITQLELMYRG